MTEHPREEETGRATFGVSPLASRAHLCVFHRGRSERDALLIPFLAEGVRHGDPSLCLAADGEAETTAAQLRKAVPDGYDLVTLREPGSGHLRTGHFDSEVLRADLLEWSDRIFADPEVTAGRMASDMSWAEPLLSPDLLDDILRSEVNVTRWVRSRPMTALCFYDLDLFGGELIVPIVKAHPQVWMGGVLVENPYYHDSDVPVDGAAASDE